MKPACGDCFQPMIFPGTARILIAAILFCSSQTSPGKTVPITTVSGLAASPDGKRFAFEWLGDIWTASTDGGEAQRITNDPIRQTAPKFTPDQKRIVFCGKVGSVFQIFSVSVDGGKITQHSYHGEGYILDSISPDGKTALCRGLREQAGYKPNRLIEVDLTKDTREQLLFDATGHSAAYSPGGESVLFCRGGEQLFRKGYHGSRASKIWRYNLAAKSFELLLSEETDARSPLWHADGNGFYYVSAQDGTFNLWSRKLGSEQAQQLTFFKDDGVIFPDVSLDGTTFVFRRGFDTFRFRPDQDQQPLALELWTNEEIPEANSSLKVKISGTSSADFNPSLDRVVFSAGGDLWLLDNTTGKSEALTSSATAESDVHFSPDGEWVYFQRDDGLQANYFRARPGGGKLDDEQQITQGNTSKSRFALSPDGSRIAWIEGTGNVFRAAADGSDPKLIFECWDKPTIDWSPDSQWVALAVKDQNANRDIWITSADGRSEPVNLTRHPAFEGSPHWSPDGRRIAFTARRSRSGDAELWIIDFGRDGLRNHPTANDLQKISSRAKPLPTRGIEPTRVVWTSDSKSLLFQSTTETNPRLYSISIEDEKMEDVARIRGIPIRMTSDGELLWRVDRTPCIWKNGELLKFPISMSITRDRKEMVRLGFRRAWRTLGEHFYDPSMNGKNWEAIREKYEGPAVASRDSKQFDRVMSMLLGELNASHLTFVSQVWPDVPGPKARVQKAAFPGITFKNHKGAGPLVIESVLAGSPVAFLDQPPQPGDSVLKIAGEPVDNLTPLHRFFNGAENTTLPMAVKSPDGTKRVVELRCISYSKARALSLAERNARRTKIVSKSGGPPITYLSFPKMKLDRLIELETEIYRKSFDYKGLILDLRDNSGGRVADHLLAIFLQPVHSFTAARGGPEGYPTDRRTITAWNKPVIVLCNENTFSNSEIFCHALKQTGRGPLVGAPTNGGVISAVTQTIPDVGTLQIPFRGWFDARTGEDLELNGAVPDYQIGIGPEDEVRRDDPQLSKAIEVLQEKIAEQPERLAPRFRSGRD